MFLLYFDVLDLESWLKLYGYDMSKLTSSDYLRDQIYNPTPRITSDVLLPNFHVYSGLVTLHSSLDKKFKDTDFIQESLLQSPTNKWQLAKHISSSPLPFGNGIIISSSNGRARINYLPSSDEISRDVVISVFNNSYLANFHFSSNSRDTYHFIKEGSSQLQEDRNQLLRLSGVYNVSVHDTESGSDMKLSNRHFIIIIHYTKSIEHEIHKLVKHAHKHATEKAWALEKERVKHGFITTVRWTNEQKLELLRSGKVSGYHGRPIHSHHKYRQIADDPNNILFEIEHNRKRRKSHLHHHWREYNT